MDFTVNDWMNDLVVYIEPEKPLTEALALMRRRYISSIIVHKDNGDYGIVTSTDVCDKVIAKGENPAKMLVKDVMTSPLITIHRDSSIKDCSILMNEKRIHHLPVINDDGVIVGMISATDFLVVAEAMGRAPGERII